MTLRLILTRHAKSGWDDPDLADHDRPLNARGQRDAPRIGAWLHHKGYLPDVALVSSARRAQETWAGIAPELGCEVPMVPLPALYHAQPDVILAHLRGQTAPMVMVIAHNPGIGDFAARCLQTPVPHPRFGDYPTCSTLVVDFPGDDWAGVTWHTGRTLDFIVPREL